MVGEGVSQALQITPSSFRPGCITNTLVGISGETVPEGGNLCIYYVQSHHLVSGGSKFTAGVSHHTPPPAGGVGSTQQF